MTIGGWVLFSFVAIAAIGLCIFLVATSSTKKQAAAYIAAAVVIIAGTLGCELWYFKNTASGQRAVIDQRSNLSGGLNRTINIYTANGNLLASYSGKIDIEEKEGGYVKFDFEGRRYIYYNCFIETIAELYDPATPSDLQPATQSDLYPVTPSDMKPVTNLLQGR